MRISFTLNSDSIAYEHHIFPPSRSLCPSGNPTSFAPLLSGHCVQMRFSIDPTSTLLPCSYLEEEEIFRCDIKTRLSERLFDIVEEYTTSGNWKRSFRIPFPLLAQCFYPPRSRVTFSPLSSPFSRITKNVSLYRFA